MSNDFDAMSNFLSRLEQDLKDEAVNTGRRRATVPRTRRLAVALPVAVVGAIVLAVAIGPFAGNTPPAYGKPAILQTPPTTIPATLRGGLALEVAAGPNAALDEARPVEVFGSTAYLLSGDDAWCLSVPDPAAARPDIERGVSCVDTDEFMRFGIALIVGDRYVAAIPQGIDAPTLRGRDSNTRRLDLDAHGVVSARLATGDTVARYDIDGRTRHDTRR